MSCVSLITADIDQAFAGCSSSAVLPARRLRLMNSGSRQILSLFVGGVVSCAKPGSSQSFGREWLSFTTPVLARVLFSFTSVSLVMLGSMAWQIRGIPFCGVMSSAAVAVFLGAADLGELRCGRFRNNLVWLDSWKMWWNWCTWVVPCLSSQAWFTPCRAAVLPRLVAKRCERGFLSL